MPAERGDDERANANPQKEPRAAVSAGGTKPGKRRGANQEAQARQNHGHEPAAGPEVLGHDANLVATRGQTS